MPAVKRMWNMWLLQPHDYIPVIDDNSAIGDGQKVIVQREEGNHHQAQCLGMSYAGASYQQARLSL